MEWRKSIRKEKIEGIRNKMSATTKLFKKCGIEVGTTLVYPESTNYLLA